jgi:hypothetical protein
VILEFLDESAMGKLLTLTSMTRWLSMEEYENQKLGM